MPTEIKQPGTQPGEVATFVSPDNCETCHGNITQTVDPGLYKEREPSFGWRGSMMGNAGRDPLCWAALAGRSTPTDGSGLSQSADKEGVGSLDRRESTPRELQ